MVFIIIITVAQLLLLSAFLCEINNNNTQQHD